MKLHANTEEINRGLIFKKKAYRTGFRIELSPEEQQVYEKHKEVRKMTLISGKIDDIETSYRVESVISDKPCFVVYHSLAEQTEFESKLRESCAKFKQHLGRLVEVASGPTTVEF